MSYLTVFFCLVFHLGLFTYICKVKILNNLTKRPFIKGQELTDIVVSMKGGYYDWATSSLTPSSSYFHLIKYQVIKTDPTRSRYIHFKTASYSSKHFYIANLPLKFYISFALSLGSETVALTGTKPVLSACQWNFRVLGCPINLSK